MTVFKWISVGAIIGIAFVYLLIGWVPIPEGWANVTATLLGALATVAVAGVALLWPTIQHYWLFPNRFQIKLRDTRTRVEPAPTSQFRYIHLEVLNNHIEYPVENVRVYVDHVKFREPDRGTWSIGPVAIMWQYEDESLRNTEKAAAPHTLGMSRICDLAFIEKAAGKPPVFKLRTAHDVANFQREFASENVKITLRLFAAGDNARSAPILVDIEWDGHWENTDKLMENRLLIKQSPA